MAHTALVILNYNGKRYLEQFLPSILRFTPPGVDIIVGDNKSTDDSLSFLKKHYPEVKFVENAANYGFSKGYNEVLKRVKADYYFLLNSDVEIRGSWQPLITAMEDDALLAACQPKIMSYRQPAFFEHAGAAGGWMDYLGYPFCKGRILNHFEADHGQYDKKSEIFWASGAAMMIRAELFHHLGGFDDDFFAHMEEIDWCWKAKKCGWKIMSIPEVAVYHIGGGTLPYQSSQKIFLNFRNNLATLFKNETLHKLIFILPIRICLDGVAFFSFLIRGHVGSAIAVGKAYTQFIKWIPALYKKRKHVFHQAAGHRMNEKGIFKGSLLFNFFILRKRTFNTMIHEQTSN